MTTAHSLKALKTIEMMGASAAGWATPAIAWETQVQTIPVKVDCAACYGRGRTYQAAPPCRAIPCEACNGRGYSTGTREAEALVGVVAWPEGTRFDSRFCGGQQCGLCGKRIINPWSWQPVLGQRADGTPLGMWVGTECASHILGLDNQRMSVELAHNAATGRMEASRIWRELPKAPKPVKPAKPAITGKLPSRRELQLLVEGALSPLDVWSVSYYASAATAEMHVCLADQALDTRDTYDLRVTARHGACLKTWDRAKLRDREVWRDKGVTDVCAALEAALAAIRRDRGR